MSPLRRYEHQSSPHPLNLLAFNVYHTLISTFLSFHNMKFQLSFVAAVLSLVFAAAAAPTPADASVAPTGLSHVAPVLSPAVLDAAPLDVANAGSPVLDVYASLSQLVPKLGAQCAASKLYLQLIVLYQISRLHFLVRQVSSRPSAPQSACCGQNLGEMRESRTRLPSLKSFWTN